LALAYGSDGEMEFETSTFHLQVGEMTVILQDVAVLLGLCIDGPSVIRTDDSDWAMEHERILLGRRQI